MNLRSTQKNTRTRAQNKGKHAISSPKKQIVSSVKKLKTPKVQTDLLNKSKTREKLQDNIEKNVQNVKRNTRSSEIKLNVHSTIPVIKKEGKVHKTTNKVSKNTKEATNLDKAKRNTDKRENNIGRRSLRSQLPPDEGSTGNDANPVENKQQKQSPPALKSQSNRKKVEKKVTKKMVTVTVRKSPRKHLTPVKKVPIKSSTEIIEKEPSNHEDTSSPVLPRQLRRKKTQHYVETSVNTTTNEPTSVKTERIPIYKTQPMNDEPKKVKDPYELDIPIEKKSDLNDSSKYDKKMHEIMQNIIRRVEKKKKLPKNTKLKRVNAKKKPINNVPVQELLNQESPIPVQPKTPTKSNNVVILSDVNVIDTPGNFQNPKANSTFIQAASSPWRFPSENIIFNPHFIKLKDTALPAINQEPIIDYKLEESYKTHITPPQQQKSVRKSPIQTSILNYVKVPDNFDLSSYQTINNSYSLFDADQLSPIKVRPSAELKQTVKRNILTESNQQNPPSNRATLFGFNQTDDEIKENKENSPSSPVKRPFRIDLKQYKRKSVSKPVEVQEVIEEEPPEYEESEKEEDDVETRPIALFDDPEDMFNQNPPNLTKKRRRPRNLSTTSDGDDVPRKKKKDQFTKEEEEAFNKWANEFNSMCKEIEKHKLEIE